MAKERAKERDCMHAAWESGRESNWMHASTRETSISWSCNSSPCTHAKGNRHGESEWLLLLTCVRQTRVCVVGWIEGGWYSVCHRFYAFYLNYCYYFVKHTVDVVCFACFEDGVGCFCTGWSIFCISCCIFDLFFFRCDWRKLFSYFEIFWWFRILWRSSLK